MSAHAPAATVGIIYPGHAAEDDYALAAEILGAHLPLAHIYGTDLHAADELLDLGAPERLADGAAALLPHRPGSVMWACTSGGFVRGPDGARRQVERLSRAAGMPASSTSLAFLAALEVLGVSRVAVVATYPDDVAAMFSGLLADAGIAVVAARSAGITTAAEVATLAPDRVRELVTAHQRSDAGAVLVPDTALRTVGLLPELESLVGRPVLTANQVTVWQGLRLAGARTTATNLGQLFLGRQDRDHR